MSIDWPGSPSGYPSSVNVPDLVSKASNVVTGDNPPYTVGDFLAIYPQFGVNSSSQEVVPSFLLDQFIAMANSCLKEAQYFELWSYCMGLFVAHFATIYLMGTSSADSGAQAVISAAKSRGLETSKSVDSVSVSYDFSQIGQDLAGWAAWTLTIYGVQFATMAKLNGLGGMYVW